MAVAHGEVGFDADGERFRLYFGMNAICSVEAEFDTSFMRVVERIFPAMSFTEIVKQGGQIDLEALAGAAADVRLGDVRSVFRAGLSRFHPDMTDVRSGDLIDELGVEEAMALLGKAMGASTEASEPADPSKAARTKRSTR